MENFTPYSALLGGCLIGLSAGLLMLLNGRIAGISGIFSGALAIKGGDRLWRWLFIAGLLLGAFVCKLIGIIVQAPSMDVSLLVVIVAGLLVGFGTSLGGGCTSGHAVCGLARLSIRSAAATGTFMLVAAITVYVMRHLVKG